MTSNWPPAVWNDLRSVTHPMGKRKMSERHGTVAPRGQGGGGMDVARNGMTSPQVRLVFTLGRAKLYEGNCMDWLARAPDSSIHAVVTDPPYGLVEYTEKEQAKLRRGRGGVWRIPPSFDGH